ncbi:MAG TPA: transmembrane 220 family protein [Chitinophagales bacterium]|nr:transmembrane 220 family protein [Chitinophagales bacterium]
MRNALNFLSLAFALLFIGFAAVQYNDPDRLVWIYAYLLPAYISFSAFRNRFNKGLIAAVALAAFSGAVTFFPYGHFEGIALKDGMKTIEIELARESLGLGIVFIGMLMHLFQSFSKSR